MTVLFQRLRALCSPVVFACALSLAGSGTGLRASEGTRRSFDIPAGDAVAALRGFASQSDVQLIYSGHAVAGVKTSAIKGYLTPLEALERMVRGTRLTVTRDEQTGAFAIIPGEAESPSAAKNDSSEKKN